MTNWPLSTNVSHTPIHYMYMFGQKRDIAVSVCSYYPKNIHVGAFTIIIPNTCVSGADILNEFGISFLFQF